MGEMGFNLSLGSDMLETLGRTKEAAKEAGAEIRTLKKEIKAAKKEGRDADVQSGQKRLQAAEARRDALRDKVDLEKAAAEAGKKGAASAALKMRGEVQKAVGMLRGGFTARDIGGAGRLAQGLGERLVERGLERGGRLGDMQQKAGLFLGGKGAEIASSAARVAGPAAIAAAATHITMKFLTDSEIARNAANVQAGQTASELFNIVNADKYSTGLDGRQVDRMTASAKRAGSIAFKANVMMNPGDALRMLVGIGPQESKKYKQQVISEEQKRQLRALKLGRGFDRNLSLAALLKSGREEIERAGRFSMNDPQGLGIVEGLLNAATFGYYGQRARVDRAREIQDKTLRAEEETRAAEVSEYNNDPVKQYSKQQKFLHLRALERQEFSIPLQWSKG